MPDTLFSRAQAIAHEALELPSPQRAGFLDDRCQGDDALAREAQWLIAAAEDDSLDAVPGIVAEVASDLAANLRINATTPGRYRLIERLGEGGMGVVWLAEREIGGVTQRVALKRLRMGSTGQQARFKEEQRILAALDHPNIARLVDIGDDSEGNPFLAMEYIVGQRIDHWCAMHAPSLRACIALFLKVCAAVSYAHEHLVIHRDLKPANLLVDVAGEPKLLDFGIARLLDAEASSATVTRLMTPAYASPEQIEGKPLGVATDVWSLGVMLYELLAGVRPFAHCDTDHTLVRAILSGTVAPPSQPQAATPGKRPRIPADIDAIVLKALRRESGQRYASVRALADDLENFLAARPVAARRGQWAYRAQRFVQRHRWPLIATTALVAVITGFTWRTQLAEREARLQAQVAERTIEFLISSFALSDPTQAERHDFSARDVLDRSRDHMNTELAEHPRVRARLLEALGNAYRGINEGTSGTRLLDEAARLNLDQAVNDPLAAARSLRAKALGILARYGSTVEAEEAAHAALELVRRHAEGDGLLLADAYATLAQALNAAGKEVQALDMARQVLALRENGGANPQDIARSLVELCSITAAVGEYAQAMAHCQRALPLYAEAGATSGNEYRTALGRLATALFYSGDIDSGMAITRQRLALTRNIFGEDSAALAMERASFAAKLAEYGRFDEADALLVQGLPILRERYGAQGTQYAQAVFHSGWLNFQRGQFDAAVPLLRQALSLHEAAVEGRDNDRIQVLRVTLAMALIESGRRDEEIRALLETVITDKGSSALPVVLAFPRLPLAQWMVSNGRHQEAEALLDQVQAIGAQGIAELHARANATRAIILHARGDETGALRLHQVAYDIHLRGHGPQHPRTARYALAYARALRNAGDATAAQALEDASLPILEAAYPPDSAFRHLLPER